MEKFLPSDNGVTIIGGRAGESGVGCDRIIDGGSGEGVREIEGTASSTDFFLDVIVKLGVTGLVEQAVVDGINEG